MDALTEQSIQRQRLRILGIAIAAGLAIVGALSGYWSYAMSGTATPLRWWGNWLQDVGTEMLGSAVTILLVELVIYQQRDETSRLDQERMRRRDQFIEQLKTMRSPLRRQKVIDRMRQQNLFENALLYEMQLQNADLQQSDFSGADLCEANLAKSNLSKADFSEAILRRANLQGCNLQGAIFDGTDLTAADLKQADLYEAVLKNVDLSQAMFDEQTRLPDGRYWQPELDLDAIA